LLLLYLDSRGCVVVQNADLKEISKYIELDRTPIIVVQDIFFLSKSTWERNRKELNETIQKWGDAWQSKDFNNYISHYVTKLQDNFQSLLQRPIWVMVQSLL
jgi:ribosomal protein S17E